MERTVIFSNQSTVTLQLLQDFVLPEIRMEVPPEVHSPILPQVGNLKEAEKEMILEALEQSNGNKAAAARALGIDPSTLWRKLKKYGIQI